MNPKEQYINCKRRFARLYRNFNALWSTDAEGYCSKCWIEKFGYPAKVVKVVSDSRTKVKADN